MRCGSRRGRAESESVILKMERELAESERKEERSEKGEKGRRGWARERARHRVGEPERQVGEGEGEEEGRERERGNG